MVMGRRDAGPAFVIDECNFDLAQFVHGYLLRSYKDLGLERGASDQKLMEHANYHGAIIVSRNKRDFRKEYVVITRLISYHFTSSSGLIGTACSSTSRGPEGRQIALSANRLIIAFVRNC